MVFRFARGGAAGLALAVGVSVALLTGCDAESPKSDAVDDDETPDEREDDARGEAPEMSAGRDGGQSARPRDGGDERDDRTPSESPAREDAAAGKPDDGDRPADARDAGSPERPLEDAGTPDAAKDAGSADASAPEAHGGECRGSDKVDFSLVGWAAERGGTTGGKGGAMITVRDGAALAQALKDKAKDSAPLTILVEGTITAASAGVSKFDVKDVRNLSIIGAGRGATFEGIGIKIVRSGNIVLRNLKIANVAQGDKDAISIEGPVDHVWVDHCELHAELDGVDKDHYDGLLDAKAESEYLTYSWNYLHDSWKTSLVGSSESDLFDRKLTMHHNHFARCNSRLPLFRGGQGHLFNNFYDDVRDTGVNSRLGACVRVENNYFQNAKNPWVSAYSDELGGVELICNLTVDTTFAYEDDVREPLRCKGVVPYQYAQALNATERVPEIVREHAGVGKLADPTDF